MDTTRPARPEISRDSLDNVENWRARQGSNLRPSASKAVTPPPRNALRPRLLPAEWPRRATAWCHADDGERAWRRLARRLGNPAGGPVLRVGGGALAVLMALLWLATLGLVRWAEAPVDGEAVSPGGVTAHV
jgi:hypothetical protein